MEPHTAGVIEVMKSILVYAGKSSLGEDVQESLLVDELATNLFKLRASPGLVMGLAKGDVFKLMGSAEPHIVERGGKDVVIIYGSIKEILS